MPKAFTDYEKELIGRRLLEEGYRLFSAYGLKKTNVGELAEAAGISKGAFYGFYESKEALFMDVVELAEERYRQEILAVVDRPGPTPRARLLAVLKQAFTLFKTIPILQFLTSSDYDLLSRRISPEQLQEHLTSDRAFIADLLSRCRQVGIPIRASVEEVSGLFYALIMTILHKDDLGPNSLSGAIDLLLELVAAYCLGEIEIQKDDQDEHDH
jgi:AcrR family transcriptional regulator